MKNIILILLLALIATSSEASIIDNGFKAKTGSFKSVVMVMTYSQFLDTKLSACTGTVIGPKTVLTAAHCATTEPGEYLMVSRPGDNLGTTDKSPYPFSVNGGVRVKKAYVPRTYGESYRKLVELRDRIDTLDPNTDSEVFGSLYELQEDYSKAYFRNDMAIITLEEPIGIRPSDTPKLGCTTLSPSVLVTIAGYGQDVRKRVNQNPERKLQYGHNTLSGYEDGIYMIDFKEHAQLSNRGDSGGPLFSGTSQATVFGVASTTQSDFFGRIIMSRYTSTASPAALTFYGELMSTRAVPEEIRKIVGRCL